MRLIGKGKKIALIRDRVGCWSWSNHPNRSAECALAKLRIGHVGLSEHLCRFDTKNSNLCTCEVVEAIDHYLLHCNNYHQARASLRNKLTLMNVHFDLKNILGGGDFETDKQQLILKHTVEFVISTGKLGEL